MKKLIIFDLDGVLVDSVTIGHQVISNFYSSNGYPFTFEDSIRLFSGKDEINFRKLSLERFGMEPTEQQYKGIKQEILLKAQSEIKAFNVPLLEMLVAEKIASCVASNNAKESVLKLLEHSGQRRYFTDDSIFTGLDVKQAKPAPDLFLHAARQMNAEPQNCIVIEDSAAGIEAGLAAGMPVIAYLGSTHTSFNWYQDRIRKYDVLAAYDDNEVVKIVKDLWRER